MQQNATGRRTGPVSRVDEPIGAGSPNAEFDVKLGYDPGVTSRGGLACEPWGMLHRPISQQSCNRTRSADGIPTILLTY